MGYYLQMNWQPNLRRKTGPPLGLKNLGNSCYLNSVLQCLTYTPPLAYFCLKSQHSSSCDSGAAAASEKKNECPFCILEKRIARSLSLESALDTPAKINNCLKIFAQHFRYGRQEDAHEFLRYVIDACHNTCLRLKKLQQQRRKGGGGGADGNGNTIVKEIFGGALQSQVKCLSCGAESNKVDEIMDISLDVLHSSSLKDALQRFFQPEVLDGNNKYKCENCKKLVTARKQMSILQAPNVLVIQLKRFEGIYGGKIDKPIAFEEVLVLSSYMCKASQDLHPEYNLFGTIVHSGFSPDSGHYYAYIKDAVGRWYCCNDSCVSLSTLQEVLSEKVYILFFSRTKQRSPPTKTCLSLNGSKSNHSNGLAKSKISTFDLAKAENGKQVLGHSSDKENVMTSKVSKVHSSPVRELNTFERSSIKKIPTSGNIKIVVHQRKSGDRTGDMRASVLTEKEVTSLPERNGVSKSCGNGQMTRSHALTNGNGKLPIVATNSIADGPHKDYGGSNGKAAGRDPYHEEVTRSSSLANGNGKIQSVATDTLRGSLHRNNGENSEGLAARISVNKEMPNGHVESSSVSGSKRKSPDQCILLEQDAQSRAKVEELKKELYKEASLVLRTCGWSEEVYAFMRTKKSGAQSDFEASDMNAMKKLLIADAKPMFISRIPESLKGSLIKRLTSFSQGTPPSST
ncbi:ubiquitin carboxyl-terminal hydrolase 25 [Lycium barbarum]|uniref:ubiquitin carboxyl-terminal hydrolase 25 n=1 Tax=Lycium barbarum TaxID=112863 RepID=UPI00293EA8C5|nr:ubiquitin carboxyl-terminal hydrolase 25 [Lycium barbarum]